MGEEYIVDLGIHNYEKENKDHSDFYNIGKISDIGDLSTYYGYEVINAENFTFQPEKTYPKIIPNFEEFKKLDFIKILDQGYTTISIDSLPAEIKFIHYPVNIINTRNIKILRNNTIPKPPLNIGLNPTFLLYQNDKVVYAVINGFVFNLSKNKNSIINAIVK